MSLHLTNLHVTTLLNLYPIFISNEEVSNLTKNPRCEVQTCCQFGTRLWAMNMRIYKTIFGDIPHDARDKDLKWLNRYNYKIYDNARSQKIIQALTFVWTVNLTFSLSLKASEISTCRELSFRSTVSDLPLWNNNNIRWTLYFTNNTIVGNECSIPNSVQCVNNHS